MAELGSSERFHSPEMERLMNEVQELMEAKVIALVSLGPSGQVRVHIPPAIRAETAEILRSIDWSLV